MLLSPNKMLLFIALLLSMGKAFAYHFQFEVSNFPPSPSSAKAKNSSDEVSISTNDIDARNNAKANADNTNNGTSGKATGRSWQNVLSELLVKAPFLLQAIVPPLYVALLTIAIR
jgi:hypothetical protein